MLRKSVLAAGAAVIVGSSLAAASPTTAAVRSGTCPASMELVTVEEAAHMVDLRAIPGPDPIGFLIDAISENDDLNDDQLVCVAYKQTTNRGQDKKFGAEDYLPLAVMDNKVASMR
ncbi:hypothetical protein [Naasia sp. SYSU D00948]|uniref:hypothetical protein n=1 Tax=Naasia sp. SYSU D00948 TaxID=2817379 RepID=UPI001B302828|nr:hypothetical protein [Naasia sp. SYSU D00948]